MGFAGIYGRRLAVCKCRVVPGLEVQLVRIKLDPVAKKRNGKPSNGDLLTTAWQLDCLHGRHLGVGLFATGDAAVKYAGEHGWQVIQES